MTCHVAFSSKTGAVMLSDSQLSTDKVEFHGIQKQFVGNDFLLGGSGNALVIREMFTSLCDATTGECLWNNTEVVARILDFLENKVTVQARATVSFLLVRPCPINGHRIELVLPHSFRYSIPQKSCATIGSGSELVWPAIRRDTTLALFSQPHELTDMLVAGENYLDAAAQSLTVDTQFTVGMLRSDRAYIMGDKQIGANFTPPVIRSQWSEVAKRYKAMMDQARLVRGEIREAQRALSKIQTAQLDSDAIHAIEANQQSVEINRQQLQNKLEDYYLWYDGVLSR